MKTRDLAAAAVFIALTFVVTRYTAMPIPATRGFFNLGEAVIYIAAIAFGPIVGMLAGGIGSALADLQVAPYYAPFTLVIKGVEGYVVGRLAGSVLAAVLRATVAGGALMVAGYFLSQVLFFQLLRFAPNRTAALGAALTELPFNVVQVAVGVIVALIVAPRLRMVARERMT